MAPLSIQPRKNRAPAVARCHGACQLATANPVKSQRSGTSKAGFMPEPAAGGRRSNPAILVTRRLVLLQDPHNTDDEALEPAPLPQRIDSVTAPSGVRSMIV